jgi:hypothetical protein
MPDDDGSPTPPSLPPARTRTRARGSLLKLIGSAVVLMAFAGTAFAMRSGVANDERRAAPTGAPSAPSSEKAASASHALVGPSAEAHELKSQKDQKAAPKHQPTTKARAKSKAPSRRHS